ncbi:flavin reductase family protein [Nocardioides gilvus]|uniref:flavin reductase family protein n=1 Tax=Nocardioides gilvus TaxID=1735589 RepID=UPI000D7438A6|nr:flavin reductase [Nocardioides gilvus]
MSETAFDTLMASIDPPLVVVTTAAEDERAGCLVGFHAQSSIDREHYCLWLSKANHTYRTSLRSAHFAVHFLTDADREMAERFGTRTGEETDKFAGLDLESDEHGVPLIKDLPNRILLDRLATLDDGGDHVCVTSLVREARTSGPFTPLRLSDAEGLEPGHAAEERAVRP